ncbi:MAG: hypothetical protein FWG83_06755 [Oscillospiraceae bacterium]|nr:hypothetical protein [Oscillospiraceae bacterium]
MKTALIDRSLVGMQVSSLREDSPPKEDVQKVLFMYVDSLIESGASYVEIDFQALLKLPKPSGAEKYIYRLGAPEEFVVANALSFEYALVPLRWHYIAPKIERPVILEIEVGNSNILKVLQLLSSEVDFSSFSMFRFIGEFEPDSIAGIVSLFRQRTVIPLDLCPTNHNLSALSAVIDACKANCDAVTVSFGDYEKFAALEEVLIMLSSMHKIMVSPYYLSGICKASLFQELLREEESGFPSNLAAMMRRYMHRPINIERVDGSDLAGVHTPMVRMPGENRQTTIENVLDSMGLEREMRDELVKILDECNTGISGGARRLRLKEEDFIQ